MRLGEGRPKRGVHVRGPTRVMLVLAVILGTMVAAGQAGAATYVLTYKQQATAADLRVKVEMAGGQLVANYDAIGVAIAKSDSATFAQAFANDKRIESVAASTSAVARLTPAVDAVADASPGDLPNAPAGVDPLAPLQWDMRQIHAPEANAITGGSSAVVVGDLDTGLDKDHPDLIPNIDFARSVSCQSGAPVSAPTAWDDHNGHGTHTSTTAAGNGKVAADIFDVPRGIISGIAPRAHIMTYKVCGNDGCLPARLSPLILTERSSVRCTSFDPNKLTPLARARSR